MDDTYYSLNSVPTMAAAGGHHPQVVDEPSLGFAPTMVPGGGGSTPGESILGRIDQYELIRKLGGGGFGVVYLARDTNSGVEVALKTLHPLLKSNAEEMDALREKFALVARLTHTNIAKALVLHLVQRVSITDESVRHELHLSPGDSVMVMDYAPGVTLSKWRKQFPDGKVPLPLAIEIGRQIASALDYAHGEKIVHRDIKPANIMVETLGGESHTEAQRHREGGASSPSEPSLTTNHYPLTTSKIRVRILDFGLAAEIRSSMSRVSTEKGDTSGTRPYMAPEQWLGRKQDGRTDQYALACVLYELLSGAPPFAGVFETGDPAIMANAVESRQPEEIDDVQPAVNAALLKALSKLPNDRFESCGELIRTLVSKSAVVIANSPVAKDRDANTERGNADKNSNNSSFKFPKTFVWLTASCVAITCVCIFFRVPNKQISTSNKESAHPGKESVINRRTEVAQYSFTDEELDAFLQRNLDVEEEKKDHPLIYDGVAAGERKVIHIGAQEVAFHWCPATTSDEWKRLSGGSDYFLMGSPPYEMPGDSETQHLVKLSTGFWMSETEVTQGLWKEIMGENPSVNKAGDNYPVEFVSWDDCQLFLQTMNERADIKQVGLKFALPTESQWEYACRAGSTDLFGGSGCLDDMGWYHGNSGDVSHSVAKKEANAWGLHDMHGNVSEWCLDWFGSYPASGDTDPSGPASDTCRVLRGGTYWSLAWACRAASRSGNGTNYRRADHGLRIIVVRDPATFREERDFAGGETNFDEAERSLESMLAEAQKAQRAARIAKGLAEANAAKTRGDWENVLAKATDLLQMDADNADALALKTEAEGKLQPFWVVSATLDGKRVSRAKLAIEGRTYDLRPTKRFKVSTGKAFGPGTVTYENNGKTYSGILPLGDGRIRLEGRTQVAGTFEGSQGFPRQ